MNLTFIKNLDCGEAKEIRIRSARNTERQLVGFAQLGEWIASVPWDLKIMSSTKGRTVTWGYEDRIFRWRRYQGWFEKRRVIITSQKEQKGVGARSITIITLTRKQNSDSGRFYLRLKKLAKLQTFYSIRESSKKILKKNMFDRNFNQISKVWYITWCNHNDRDLCLVSLKGRCAGRSGVQAGQPEWQGAGRLSWCARPSLFRNVGGNVVITCF